MTPIALRGCARVQDQLTSSVATPPRGVIMDEKTIPNAVEVGA